MKGWFFLCVSCLCVLCDSVVRSPAAEPLPNTKPLTETRSETASIDAPSGLPTSPGSFVAVDIAADHQAHPVWKQPVRAFFRRDGAVWKLVGFERQPDKPAEATPQKTTR